MAEIILSVSDHSSLLISCERNSVKGPSRFRFLHTWIRHQGFMDVVRQSWVVPVDYGSGMVTFQHKVHRLNFCLKAWNKDVFGNVF